MGLLAARDSLWTAGTQPRGTPESRLFRKPLRFQKGEGTMRLARLSELPRLGHGRGSSILSFKRLIRNSQEYFDFFRFSRGRRRQGDEVFEETGPRKTGGAKVPFDNFDPENYLGDAGLRSAATRFASPIMRAQGVENTLICHLSLHP